MEIKKYFKISIFLVILLFIPIFQTHSFQIDKCDLNKIRPVEYKQKNIYVRNLQNCLLSLGYKINKKELGYYGKTTILAVRQFYRENATKIYNIAKGVNTLSQIKNWKGYKFGPAGVSYLKKLILSKKPSPVYPSKLTLNDIFIVLTQKIIESYNRSTTSIASTSTNLSVKPFSEATSYQVSSLGGTNIFGEETVASSQISFQNFGYIFKGERNVEIKFVYPVKDEYILFGVDYPESVTLSANSIFVIKLDKDKKIKWSKRFTQNNQILDIKKVLKLTDSDFLLLIDLLDINNLDMSTALIKISDDKIVLSKKILFSNYVTLPVDMDILDNSNLILLVSLRNPTSSMIGLYKIPLSNLETILCGKAFYKQNSILMPTDLEILNNEIYILANHVDENSSTSIFTAKFDKNCQFVKGNLLSLEQGKINPNFMKIFNNDLLLSGSTFSAPIQADIFLALMDNNFTIKWQKIYSNSDVKYISNIIPLDDLRLILVGNRKPGNIENTTSFLLKIKGSNGDIELQKFLNSTYDLLFNDVYQIISRYLIISGSGKLLDLQNQVGLFLSSDVDFNMPFKKEYNIDISTYNLVQSSLNFVKSDISLNTTNVTTNIINTEISTSTIDFEQIELF